MTTHARILFALASTLLPACGEVIDHGCTDIGCVDEVTVSIGRPPDSFFLSPPLSAHVCVEAGCSDVVISLRASGAVYCQQAGATPVDCAVLPDGAIVVHLPLAAATAAVEAHVTLTTDSMQVVLFDETETVDIMTTQPNGDDCPPLCRQGAVTFTP